MPVRCRNQSAAHNSKSQRTTPLILLMVAGMKIELKCFLPVVMLLFAAIHPPSLAQQPTETDATVQRILGLLLGESEQLDEQLDYLERHWQPGMTPMLVEILTLARNRTLVGRLTALLERNTGQDFGHDVNRWFRWLWNQAENRHPQYAQFKSRLYQLIDPRFAGYFAPQRASLIRLDEIRWGGVRQDGIPPLRQPEMVPAAAADYLDDDNVVFGVKINGDARAYPKRILAWHEMFVDQIGGVRFAGVYCTLCGAVILYETVYNGVEHALGTSGFLYRSNKLMYDRETQSLWNSTWGEPVVGPLAGQGIRLRRSYLVTTTWGEWKRRHPDTTVLSLATGHRRDYAEGAAYRQYFATDELMFEVPQTDARLNNKDEVLALIFPEVSLQPLAISADYLAANPLYHDRIEQLELVVLTDRSGANRVYATEGRVFSAYDGDAGVTDNQGRRWKMTEAALTTDTGEALPRLPAHRAFWFGWYAAHNATRLVK